MERIINICLAKLLAALDFGKLIRSKLSKVNSFAGDVYLRRSVAINFKHLLVKEW